MSEVTAEMIEQGRNGDPAATTRRRKMNIKLRQARETLTSTPDAISRQALAMVRLFAQSIRSATPMLGAIALAIGATTLFWIDPGVLAKWLVFQAGALAIVYGLSIAFLDRPDEEKSAAAWRRKFILAMAVIGCAWTYLIVHLLMSSNPDARSFAVLVVLLISAIMSLLASPIPAAFGAAVLPIVGGMFYAFEPRLQGTLMPSLALCVGVIGLFPRRRQSAAVARSRILFVPGREGRADRRTRTGQAQFGRGAAARRKRQSGEVALPGDDEPRAAHAAQRHPRLLRGDEGRIVRVAQHFAPTRNIRPTSTRAASIC